MLSPKKDLAINVAPTAPIIICPSIPIFHIPAENVYIKAREAKEIGTQTNRVRINFE